MNSQSSTLDATMAAAGSKVTYAGAGASISGWLLSSEAGVLAGIVIGLIGLIINFWFRRREDQRLQVEHELRVQEILRERDQAMVQ